MPNGTAVFRTARGARWPATMPGVPPSTSAEPRPTLVRPCSHAAIPARTYAAYGAAGNGTGASFTARAMHGRPPTLSLPALLQARLAATRSTTAPASWQCSGKAARLAAYRMPAIAASRPPIGLRGWNEAVPRTIIALTGKLNAFCWRRSRCRYPHDANQQGCRDTHGGGGRPSVTHVSVTQGQRASHTTVTRAVCGSSSSSSGLWPSKQKEPQPRSAAVAATRICQPVFAPRALARHRQASVPTRVSEPCRSNAHSSRLHPERLGGPAKEVLRQRRRARQTSCHLSRQLSCATAGPICGHQSAAAGRQGSLQVSLLCH